MDTEPPHIIRCPAIMVGVTVVLLGWLRGIKSSRDDGVRGGGGGCGGDGCGGCVVASDPSGRTPHEY